MVEKVTNDTVKKLKNKAIEEELKRKTITFSCPMCGAIVTKFLNYVKHNTKKGKAGPFCSRKCAGTYSVYR